MTESKDNQSGSVYERVMAAAMEAKRLNSRQQMSNVTPRRKVTSEAIQRVDDGEVSYEMAETTDSPPTEGDTPLGESAEPQSSPDSTDDETKGENDTWTH